MAEMENSENVVETEEKPKRKLVKTVLDNFSKLTNPHENVRVKSAANLLKYLVENHGTEEVRLYFYVKTIIILTFLINFRA